MKKYIYGILGFVVLVVLDQLSKFAAVTNLKGNDGISLIDGVFRLMYLENYGAAFGMLKNKRVFLVIVTVIILALVLFGFSRIPATKRFLPLQMVLVGIAAGAVGNMIDRIVNGYVTDFLYFELINFPVFNVADCYVVIAAAAAMFLIIFYYKDEDFEAIKKK